MRLLFITISLLPFCWTFTLKSEDSSEPLILTPYIENKEYEKAKELSKFGGIYAQCAPESYSGFLTVNKTFNSNMFFWFFKSQEENAPILLWLQGGPGGSSLIGLFGLIGPFEIDQQTSEVRCRQHAWTKSFSMLYIDNPIGAGFSFTKNPEGYSKSQDEVTDNLYEALRQFFALFSELKKNEFYATGESYAGKYIPSLGYKLLQEQPDFLNFKGISIGNGYIDPISMMNYGPFLYHVGLIDEIQMKQFEQRAEEIVNLMNEGKWELALNKTDLLISRGQGYSLFEQTTGYDFYYDIRHTTMPHNFGLKFLETEDFRGPIHVGDQKFVLGAGLNPQVFWRLAHEFLVSAKDKLARVREKKKVLLYYGNLDVASTPSVGLKFLQTLDWSGKDKYARTTRQFWKVSDTDTQIAGYVRKVKKLREVIVRNAGHFVPIDQPRVALDMMNKFVTGSF